MSLHSPSLRPIPIPRPGPAGKSAYALAVEEGFNGTLAQWLASLVGPVGDAAIADHLTDDTPHPVYDDLPSLALLFENGLT